MSAATSEPWQLAQAQISIARFEAALARWPERLALRCFTAEERGFAEGRRNAAQHLAVRFAAKRAARQLLGAGDLRQIEVARAVSGAPSLRLHGLAAQAAAGRTLHLSLSHDADAAVALVAMGPGPASTSSGVAR
jgi:holo-[acyl-carrier protein] synthase